MPRKSDTSKSRKKAGRLSREDRALWDHVADQVSPLERTRTVQTRAITEFEELLGEPRSASRPHPGGAKPNGAHHPGTPNNLANGHANPGRTQRTPAAATGSPSPPALPQTGLDDRTTRRISRGRDVIDGRIDLHGMRQSEAERALKRFLFASHARDARTVLVITGKGATGSRSLFEDPDAHEMHREPRGVLKRRVPQWLQATELRSIVVGFGPAHQKHGGDGALYVRLKSKR